MGYRTEDNVSSIIASGGIVVADGTHKSYAHDDLSCFSLLNQPIWVYDIVNKKMWWANDAGLQFWQASSVEELCGRNFASGSETVHKKNMDTLERMKRNERWGETWTLYPGGQAHIVDCTFSGIHIQDDGHLCMLVHAQPVEQNEKTSTLLQGEAMLKYLPISVCQFDIDGTLKYQNPEACAVFGWDNNNDKAARTGDSRDSTINNEASAGGADDNIDKGNCTNGINSSPQKKNRDTDESKQEENGGEETTIDNLTSTSANHFVNRFVDRNEGKKIFHQIKDGKDISVEVLVHTKNGPEWNAIHTRLGNDSNSDQKKMIYFSARNISDIVNAKREIQLNLERAEFFAIMAHEIRTPLFQVTGFIDLLDQTTNLNSEQKGYIHVLKSSASGLMAVINDVLDYSKLEAGKMKLDNIPFEPKAVADGSLAAVAVAAESKGLTLKSSFPARVPVKLIGDPNRLRQVLSNLLNNAIKFTHQGSIELSVEMLVEDDPLGRVLLRFSVQDTGIGISPDHLSNIFGKYSQATASISSSYGGTGLGLSICKSLVECMNGEIGVNSIQGKGSKFWFQIPFPRPSITDLPPSPVNLLSQEMKDENSSNLHVLVAEDNGVNQKLISRMLSRLGHDVTVVDNGEEAVRAVQEGRFDLVLMDIQMPVMDGIDATKEIRCLGLTLPIVGLTASVRREDFEGIGLSGWIGKPVRLKELQSKITETISQ